MFVVAFWALLAIILFAWAYCTLPWFVPCPGWMPGWISNIVTMSGNAIDPVGLKTYAPDLAPWARWFFVSFDIFTNLGIRNTHPQNTMGVILVFIETVLGYVTLGLLISVLTNKFARRS